MMNKYFTSLFVVAATLNLSTIAQADDTAASSGGTSSSEASSSASSSTSSSGLAPTRAEGISSAKPNLELPRRPIEDGFLYRYSARQTQGTGPVTGSKMQIKNGFSQSHSLGVRQAINEKWTFRVEGSFNESKMDYIRGGNAGTFTNSGFADTKTGAVYTLFKNPLHYVEIGSGLSLPTGSITAEISPGRIAPSMLQLGSGTYDIQSFVAYGVSYEKWTSVNRLETTDHLGTNSLGYTKGDDYGFSTSLSYSITKYLAPVFTARIGNKAKTHGMSPGNAPVPVPTASALVASQDGSSPDGKKGPKGGAGDASTTAGPGGKGGAGSGDKPKVRDAVTAEDPNANPLNRSGTSWDGQVALRGYLPLKRSNPLRISFEIGVPVFSGSENGAPPSQTLWFASSSIAASF